jgi:hypothetical protein
MRQEVMDCGAQIAYIMRCSLLVRVQWWTAFCQLGNLEAIENAYSALNLTVTVMSIFISCGVNSS